jgi:hypothetical protein
VERVFRRRLFLSATLRNPFPAKPFGSFRRGQSRHVPLQFADFRQ